jgi:hypothetical protein
MLCLPLARILVWTSELEDEQAMKVAITAKRIIQFCDILKLKTVILLEKEGGKTNFWEIFFCGFD